MRSDFWTRNKAKTIELERFEVIQAAWVFERVFVNKIGEKGRPKVADLPSSMFQVALLATKAVDARQV